MVAPFDDPRGFDALLRVLRGGGVAIAPGDTMYGLIGVAPGTEERLRLVKGRGEEKPFILLLADASWLAKVTDAPLPSRLARYWPGPLTMVFPGRQGGTVAVRVPDDAFLRRLLLALGQPLYSTSVNRAGEPPAASVAEMRRLFEGEVDIILDGGDRPPGAPSTLLEVSRRPFRILRQGAMIISPEDLS